MTSATRDPWLARWLPLIGERAAGSPILELGCGGGRDSIVLAAAGHRVIGVDFSSPSIAEARQTVPSGEFHCRDIRAEFPVAAGGTGVIVASLSLHYFPWSETVALAGRICETLRPSGVLLCRLNSTNDHHHGASGHPTIDENYYLVEGAPKRFFDRVAVEHLFAHGWRVIHKEEGLIDRYDHPKSVWEVVLEKTA